MKCDHCRENFTVYYYCSPGLNDDGFRKIFIFKEDSLKKLSTVGAESDNDIQTKTLTITQLQT